MQMLEYLHAGTPLIASHNHTQLVILGICVWTAAILESDQLVASLLFVLLFGNGVISIHNHHFMGEKDLLLDLGGWKTT